MKTTNKTAQSVDFIQDLKNTIKDRLNDYAGGSYYGCDLAYTLFEGENANGSVFCNTYETKQFIKANFDLFGALVDYVKQHMDMSLKPFNEPEKAHVILLLEASQSLLAKCKLVDTKWNDEIELTAKNIKTLCAQIDALNITEEDLF